DVAVADAAGGQQEDAGALGVDGVFALAFHPAEFLLLVRAERAYLNFVHGPSPRLSMVAHHNVETVFIPSPHATELNNQSQLNTKRTDWTRHYDLVATVSPTSGSSPTPTGDVTFVDTTTGATLGVRTLNPSGKATLTVNGTSVAFLDAGLHSIRASYLG